VGKSGYAYMYNTAGLVVAHPDPEKVLNLNLSGFNFGRDMLSRKKGATTYTFEGVEKKLPSPLLNGSACF
jgi:methyl-accepting chemotaxis protein